MKRFIMLSWVLAVCMILSLTAVAATVGEVIAGENIDQSFEVNQEELHNLPSDSEEPVPDIDNQIDDENEEQADEQEHIALQNAASAPSVKSLQSAEFELMTDINSETLKYSPDADVTMPLSKNRAQFNAPLVFSHYSQLTVTDPENLYYFSVDKAGTSFYFRLQSHGNYIAQLFKADYSQGVYVYQNIATMATTASNSNVKPALISPGDYVIRVVHTDGWVGYDYILQMNASTALERFQTIRILSTDLQHLVALKEGESQYAPYSVTYNGKRLFPDGSLIENLGDAGSVYYSLPSISYSATPFFRGDTKIVGIVEWSTNLPEYWPGYNSKLALVIKPGSGSWCMGFGIGINANYSFYFEPRWGSQQYVIYDIMSGRVVDVFSAGNYVYGTLGYRASYSPYENWGM